MNKGFMSHRWIIIIALVVSALACTEEIDLNTSGNPTNVVYCLLNPNVNEQYVRVGRSYLMSSETSIHDPHADSISWNDKFTVYIEEWNDKLLLENEYSFSPDNGLIKDTGFFTTEGLSILKSSFRPKNLRTYAIYVHFENDNRITSAWITIPGKVVIHDPKAIPSRKINFQSGNNYTIRWKPAQKAGAYQSFFKIIYKEITPSTWEFKEINFSTQVVLGLTPKDLMSDMLNGNRFISSCIEQVDSIFAGTREIVSTSFTMLIGGEELGLYLLPSLDNQSANLGYREYTNLKNGIGLFSSINRNQVNDLFLSNTTLDELAHSDKTRHLGFLDHYGKR